MRIRTGQTFVLLTWQLLTLQETGMGSGAAKCQTNWFGSSCQFMCHCEQGQCQESGACEKGYTCDLSWFGPECQYKDQLQGSNYNDTPWLLDGNALDEGCSAYSNCLDRLCDPRTGDCFDCAEGHWGTNCHLAEDTQDSEIFITAAVAVLCFVGIVLLILVFCKCCSKKKEELYDTTGTE